jgi:general secretion pathway protein L
VGLRTIVNPAPVEETERLAAGNGQPKEHPERLAALLVELRWSLLALNGAPLDDELPCLVAGAGVEFGHVARAIADEMGLTVRQLDDRPLRNVPPALQAQLAGFAPVLGLALREVATGESFGVNFRRGEFAFHRGEDALRRALWHTALIAAAVVALMITDTYLGYAQLARRLELTQGEIRRVFVDTLPQVQRIVDEKTQLQTEIASAEKKLQMLNGVAPMGGATAVDVMRTLSAAVPDTIRVDVDDYVMDTDGVRIKANADSFEAVDAIKQQVAATHAFSAVEVKDVKAAPDGKGVDFRLLVSLGPEGTTGTKP